MKPFHTSIGIRYLGLHLHRNRWFPNPIWTRAGLSTEAVAELEAGYPAGRDGWADSLYGRVILVADPKASLVPVLERWIEEGKPVRKSELQWFVKEMRRFRRYNHALQISMWMSDRRYFPLSPADVSDRMDLIYRARGLEHAENYFKTIPRQLKVSQPYGVLLNCYAEEKSVEKSEDLFRKMEELKMVNCFSYNVLIKLYANAGQYGKIDIIFQEMKQRSIQPDSFTYGNLMEAYVTASNTEGIDTLLKRISHPSVDKNWHVYAAAAKGYVKAGFTDKAVAALKKSEEMLPRYKRQVAYGSLLTVYADIGDKDELLRIWYAYKSSGRVSNSMYMCLIVGLLKLDDIELAEMMLKEWESQTTFFDFRVPNLLVAAYCKNGLLSKAESLVSKAIGSGRTPFANTWDRLAAAFFEGNQSPKAVEMMKKALVVGQQREWKPNPKNVNASLKYFEGQKDVDAAEDFLKLLQGLVPVTREIYHNLLRVYLAAGKPVFGVLDRMKHDGIDANEETNKILEGGCHDFEPNVLSESSNI